jgi:hypothetical protein
MSIISTAANYGGKVTEKQQDVKQFYITAYTSPVTWIYKKLLNGLVVETPSDSTKSVLIDNDLTITGSIYNTSDINLKKNITEIEISKIDNLLSLNPIHFQYSNDKKNKTHYGFIAQDVEKLYPEMIGSNDIGFKTLNYQEVIPLMLAKIKLMQKEIDELKIDRSSNNK